MALNFTKIEGMIKKEFSVFFVLYGAQRFHWIQENKCDKDILMLSLVSIPAAKSMENLFHLYLQVIQMDMCCKVTKNSLATDVFGTIFR